ncbi:hypothetical protein C8Q76DRAFT_797851 [Earliella scabrosa]|nr:hypothetical protein C8Q76DRAFT_797851 [Earliella scabrosa]
MPPFRTIRGAMVRKVRFATPEPDENTPVLFTPTPRSRRAGIPYGRPENRPRHTGSSHPSEVERFRVDFSMEAHTRIIAFVFDASTNAEERRSGHADSKAAVDDATAALSQLSLRTDGATSEQQPNDVDAVVSGLSSMRLRDDGEEMDTSEH